MNLADYTTLIDGKYPGAVKGKDENTTPQTLIIEPTNLVDVCFLLRDSDETYFDMLSCLSGIDNGPEQNTMEVVYNLYSIPFDRHLALKVILDRKKPKVQSVAEVWKTANWHEREAYDFYGILFEGHPDLRRILLPESWEGHPLLKDYKEQETYHGIKVKY